MGYLRLRHNYFRASNVSSYVVLETFFGFLLVDLPRHPVHEFADLSEYHKFRLARTACNDACTCEFVLRGRNNSHELDSGVGHCSGNPYSNAAKAVDMLLECGSRRCSGGM